MASWGWLLIWVGLSISALAYFAFIGLGLVRSAKGLFRQLEPTFANLAALAEATQAEVKYEPNPDNLLDDPGPHVANWAKLRRARTDKAAKRQRRLVNKLIDFDFEESEFKNGRT